MIKQCPLTQLGDNPQDTVTRILGGYRIHNAEVLFREDCGVDDLIDVVEVCRAAEIEAMSGPNALFSYRETASTSAAFMYTTKSTRCPSKKSIKSRVYPTPWSSPST